MSKRTNPSTAYWRSLAHVFTVVILASLALIFAGCSKDDSSLSPTGPDQDVLAKAGGSDGVQNLTCTNDDVLWGTVHIGWESPLQGPLAVVKYYVVVNSSGGAVTASNWDQATQLAEIDANGGTNFAETFDTTDSGVWAGNNQTYAVRPLYEQGVWGSIDSRSLRPTLPHVEWGYVRDDLGNPLAGVTVRMHEPTGVSDPRGFSSERTTDANGMFAAIGPVSEDMDIVLETDSPDSVSQAGAEDAYFDYRTAPLEYAYSGGAREIRLIAKRDIDTALCTSLANNYVEVLQYYSKSFHTSTSGTMYTWDAADFPLAVYIPDAVASNGGDMDQAVRDALEYYNDILGDEVFVETSNSSQAQIRFSFGTNLGDPGKMTVLEPTGVSDTDVGYVPFDVLGVQIDLGLDPASQYATYVIRHELGHTLGIYIHPSASGYLMNTGILHGYELTPGESKLIQSYRNMPDVVEMRRYEGSYPDHPVY